MDVSFSISNPITIAATGFFILQSLALICLLIYLRVSARERTLVHRELFGILKKIEGLNAHKRDWMTKQFDGMIQTMAGRLPGAIAARTGNEVFEMEKKILTRLAELEPDLKSNEKSREKMNEIIKDMESLENTVISLTNTTVREVMEESRQSIFDESVPLSQ